jgi:hypothetical protein
MQKKKISPVAVLLHVSIEKNAKVVVVALVENLVDGLLVGSDLRTGNE